MKKIKPIHCQEVLNDMYDKGLAYGTMVLARITMHAIFKDAILNEYLVKNPVNKTVKCKKRIAPDRRVLTLEEHKEFLEYSIGSMYDNLFRLALQTGLRGGELGGLKWADIDFENHVLHVRRTLLQQKEHGGFYFGDPKSKESVRKIPLTSEAEKILKMQKAFKGRLRLKSMDWSDNAEWQDLVFVTRNGHPVGVGSINNALTKVVKKINEVRKYENIPVIERITSHCLRHTFATRCFEAGMKPKILQNILGHSSITITMDMYVHALDEEKIHEMKKIVDFCAEKLVS